MTPDDNIGCESAWTLGVYMSEAGNPVIWNVEATRSYPTPRKTMPTKTLRQGCDYVPSWLMKAPERFTLPYMGTYGLQGHLRPQSTMEIE